MSNLQKNNRNPRFRKAGVSKSRCSSLLQGWKHNEKQWKMIKNSTQIHGFSVFCDSVGGPGWVPRVWYFLISESSKMNLGPLGLQMCFLDWCWNKNDWFWDHCRFRMSGSCPLSCWSWGKPRHPNFEKTMKTWFLIETQAAWRRSGARPRLRKPMKAKGKPRESVDVHGNLGHVPRQRHGPWCQISQRNLLHLSQASRLFLRKAFALVDTGKRGHSQPRLC